MKTRTLCLTAAFFLLLASCFVFQPVAFAQDGESDRYIYVPETDEEMVVDDQMNVEEETGAYYEETGEPEDDDSNYFDEDVEDMDQGMDEPAEEAYDYEEDPDSRYPDEE